MWLASHGLAISVVSFHKPFILLFPAYIYMLFIFLPKNDISLSFINTNHLAHGCLLALFIHLDVKPMKLKDERKFSFSRAQLRNISSVGIVLTEPVHDPEWTPSRMDTIPNGHNHE